MTQIHRSNDLRVFTTADTHFEHDNILGFCRPQYASISEMNEDIVYRWNSTVRPQDTVYHLGDVALTGGDEEKKKVVWDILDRLNGTLYLIAGNHDQPWIYPWFDKVFGVKERKNCILTHVPVHPSQKGRFRLNIHGHLHDKVVYLPEHKQPTLWDENFGEVLEDKFYYCTSMEQTDFAPVPFADIIHERFHSE